MPTRPRLRLGRHLLPGVIAVALFAVLAAVFLAAEVGTPQGFPGEGSITASLGYALFDIAGGAYDSEPFLVPFEIIDVVLVAALVAAVMLARREEGGHVITALTDGGREADDSRAGQTPEADDSRAGRTPEESAGDRRPPDRGDDDTDGGEG